MMLLLMNSDRNECAEAFLLEHAASFGFEDASVLKYYYAQREYKDEDGVNLDQVTDDTHASHTLYVLNLSEKDVFVYRLRCKMTGSQLSGLYERWNMKRMRDDMILKQGRILSEGIDETDT